MVKVLYQAVGHFVAPREPGTPHEAENHCEQIACSIGWLLRDRD
jgi:hypothetical protein